MKASAPCIQKLPSGIQPRQALRALAHLPYPILMESSLQREELGRFSFLAADPCRLSMVDVGAKDPLLEIQATLDEFPVVTIPCLPPFQGGWAGLLTYELGHSFECLPTAPCGPVTLPAVVMGFYDVVLMWDHMQDRSWIVSQGFPEHDLQVRGRRAADRAAYFLEQLTSSANDNASEKPHREFRLTHSDAVAAAAPIGFQEIVPGGGWSNFSEVDYLRQIECAVEYINAGDIFQTNLSQQLLLPARKSSLDLYDDLAMHNASTFGGYFDLGDTQVLSSSPERLVRISGRAIETRPIKGTRRRTKIPMVDIAVRNELEQNEKERAENTMIVDLMRNDFSRICDDDSVEVTQWCGVESYEAVYHLVSAIRGRLRVDVSASDVIKAIFPGGSVTGAPKIRAMEIISELEGITRGAYCGSLGYFGTNGEADFNILIRTITAQGPWWQIPVGGAIVSQSVPAMEYAETWTKAAAILKACLCEPTTSAHTSSHDSLSHGVLDQS